ncbi:hypothetical protein ACFRAQ_36120 [Nocardia sp. NPDC056611]|uniref:hypothetical protein n=1 Tax=Nocardia sp. NPDC056611 TaxID=3345877 RepID=UPI003671E0C0
MNIRQLATTAANTGRRIAARVRRLAAPVEIAIRNGATTTREIAAGELTLIGDELAAIGADDEWINSYSSPAGKAVAKAWRAQTGTEPRQIWSRHRRTGRPIYVKAYPTTFAGRTAIDTGFARYSRTAALLAA